MWAIRDGALATEPALEVPRSDPPDRVGTSQIDSATKPGAPQPRMIVRILEP